MFKRQNVCASLTAPLTSALASEPVLRERFANAKRVSPITTLGPLAVEASDAGAAGLLLAGGQPFAQQQPVDLAVEVLIHPHPRGGLLQQQSPLAHDEGLLGRKELSNPPAVLAQDPLLIPGLQEVVLDALLDLAAAADLDRFLP